MRVCGVDLKSDQARLVVLEGGGGAFEVVACEPRKIKLEESETQAGVRSFFQLFDGFAKEQRLELIVIKKRNRSGQFAGGALSFKLEGLIQMVVGHRVELISAQAVAAYVKKNPAGLPDALRRYQETAFDVARAAMSETG
jgi:Protein of unknown function (DUF3010)